MSYSKIKITWFLGLIVVVFIVLFACGGERTAFNGVVSSLTDGNGDGSGSGSGSGSGDGSGSGSGSTTGAVCPTDTPVSTATTLFIINGGDSNDTTWQSSDGAQWTTVRLELPTTNAFLRNFHTATFFKDEIYVIGGDYGGTDGELIYKSSDGVTWSKVTPTGTVFGPLTGHAAVVFKDELYVIAGTKYDGKGTKSNKVWKSADGTEWSEVTPTSSEFFSARSNHEAVVFNKALYVIGGDGVSSRLGDVWKSTDGKVWEQLTPTDASKALPKISSHQAVVFQNALYVLGGDTDSSSGGINTVWKSCDGKDWEKVETAKPFTARSGHKSVVFKGELYVILGGIKEEDVPKDKDDNKLSDIWKSSDAVNWEKVTTAPDTFSNTSAHAVVAK